MKFRRFIRDESGATSLEYGLIAFLMSIAAIVGMESIGTSIDSLYLDRVVAGFNGR